MKHETFIGRWIEKKSRIMWWRNWTAWSSYQGPKRFRLLKIHLARSEKNWSKIDLFHLWININLRAELEGNPSDWVAFSTSDSALFFSLFYVFYFLLSLTSSCIEKPVHHKDKIKAQELPQEEVERFTKGA